MNPQTVIAVDFDDTLMDTSNVAPGKRMGVPLPGAAEAMRKLKAEGHKLIIFTVRGGEPRSVEAVRSWLEWAAIPFDDITNVKPNASLFIDNRALRFHSWKQVMSELDASK